MHLPLLSPKAPIHNPANRKPSSAHRKPRHEQGRCDQQGRPAIRTFSPPLDEPGLDAPLLLLLLLPIISNKQVN
ncbi:hypothetical protein LY76DRAFT_365223 [Colletotrichum caudatum]|nr:hypothetical protein LY76DRAFT_365223 [Colletotrichum caudatum]